MNLTSLLPPQTLLNSRITKKALTEAGNLKPADKKILKEDIQEIHWLAAFKPENCNIPAFIDDTYCYDEVHYISLKIKSKTKAKQAAEMLQKAIPYPVVLWLMTDDEFCVCTAEKRINRNEPDKRTIESIIFAPWLDVDKPDETVRDFLDSLAAEQLPQKNLKEFHEGITSRIFNLQTAEYSGKYQIKSGVDTRLDYESLQAIREIEDKISRLRSELKKESQLNQKVELNVEIKTLEMKRNEIVRKLKP